MASGLAGVYSALILERDNRSHTWLWWLLDKVVLILSMRFIVLFNDYGPPGLFIRVTQVLESVLELIFEGGLRIDLDLLYFLE